MKSFNFSLQALYDLRQQQMDEAERRLAEPHARVHTAEQDINHQRERRTEAAANYVASLNEGAHPHELALHNNYLNALTSREQDSQSELQDLRHACDERRAETLEATQAARVTERLHDNQYALHLQEQARRQQAELDELAALAYARRQQEAELSSPLT